LVACRMIARDQRAWIARQRPEHTYDGFDLWYCGERSKFRENRARRLRSNIVQTEMKKRRPIRNRPFHRDRYMPAFPEHSQFQWRVNVVVIRKRNQRRQAEAPLNVIALEQPRLERTGGP